MALSLPFPSLMLKLPNNKNDALTINLLSTGNPPGQGPSLQARVSFVGPMQSLPPKAGGGLVQLRKRT